MNSILDTLITATVAEFCRISGMGHSKLYELLADGVLDSVKVGKRRLVVLDSYRKLIEQQRATAPPRAAENERAGGPHERTVTTKNRVQRRRCDRTVAAPPGTPLAEPHAPRFRGREYSRQKKKIFRHHGTFVSPVGAVDSTAVALCLPEEPK